MALAPVLVEVLRIVAVEEMPGTSDTVVATMDLDFPIQGFTEFVVSARKSSGTLCVPSLVPAFTGPVVTVGHVPSIPCQGRRTIHASTQGPHSPTPTGEVLGAMMLAVRPVAYE